MIGVNPWIILVLTVVGIVPAVQLAGFTLWIQSKNPDSYAWSVYLMQQSGYSPASLAWTRTQHYAPWVVFAGVLLFAGGIMLLMSHFGDRPVRCSIERLPNLLTDLQRRPDTDGMCLSMNSNEFYVDIAKMGAQMMLTVRVADDDALKNEVHRILSSAHGMVDVTTQPTSQCERSAMVTGSIDANSPDLGGIIISLFRSARSLSPADKVEISTYRLSFVPLE